MFALVAAILFFLLSIGVGEDAAIDLFYLGLAFWAAHFAWALAIPGLHRNKQQ